MKILFVTARPPWPPLRGDQARTAAWVEGLRPRHEVAVLALRPPGFAPCAFPPGVAGWQVGVGRLGLLQPLWRTMQVPLQVALHWPRRLVREFDRRIAELRPEVVVPILSRVGWVALRTEAPVVLDGVDSLALNMRSRAERQPLLGPLWRWEGRRLRRWDRKLLAAVDYLTVVSERDRDDLLAAAPEAAARIQVVPFGVRVPAELPSPDRRGPIVLVSGNLGYFPTVDGLRWLAARVWPEVMRRCPEAELWLAGSRPAAAVRRLARGPGIRLWEAPSDLRAVRRQAAVAAVPLFCGSGTPVKILEAMADGVPVVTTPHGARGLDDVASEAVAVAAGAAEFAERLAELILSPEAAERQRRAAWEWVRRTHAMSRTVARFEQLLAAARAVS